MLERLPLFGRLFGAVAAARAVRGGGVEARVERVTRVGVGGLGARGGEVALDGAGVGRLLRRLPRGERVADVGLGAVERVGVRASLPLARALLLAQTPVLVLEPLAVLLGALR